MLLRIILLFYYFIILHFAIPIQSVAEDLIATRSASASVMSVKYAFLLLTRMCRALLTLAHPFELARWVIRYGSDNLKIYTQDLNAVGAVLTVDLQVRTALRISLLSL